MANPSTSQGAGPRPSWLQPSPGAASPVFARLMMPALGLVVFIVTATAVLWPLDIRARWEPPLVNLAFNILFVGLPSFAIATLAVRSFLGTGQWAVLWLGAASLVFGLGVLTGSALVNFSSANAAVTAHNLNALVAAGFHFMGAFFLAKAIGPQEERAGRRRTALQVYIGSACLFVIIAVSAVTGVMPTFFEQGRGGTSLRQFVLLATTLLFLVSGHTYLRQYLRLKVGFLFWYSLGLVLAALGMFGVLIATALGTPLNWLGRIAQYFSGLYLLMAALTTWREARARNLPPDELLATFFRAGDANLALLFNSITDALVVTDRQFVITGWNAAAERIYGWRADEATNRPAQDVLHTRFASPAERERAQADLAAQGSWKAEVVQSRKDGSDVVVLASVSVLRDPAGAMAGAVAINRDITEGKQAQEEIDRLNRSLAQRAVELEASNRELEAFAYSVSHDLRAPLRGVDGFAQALLEDYEARLDEQGRTYLHMLRSNAKRMGDLIDDLLAFSRLGRQPISRQRVALADVVERAWEELVPATVGRQVELRIGDLPTCQADAALLRQAYTNLLSNAVKFTRTRAPAIIEVGSRRDDRDEHVLFVRDNGIGFDMQYHEKVFGVFQRLHRAEDYEGTGVGLAIVQRIVQRHGGRVWAEGAVDQGATFYFTLGEKCCE